MDGMKQAIDDVKGIEVVPDASFSVAGYSFVKGSSTHMDGREAMAYISNGNDYVREDRQRAVLSALLHKGRSISTLFNQRLINSVSGQMETDLTFDSMTLLDKNYDEVGDHTVEDNLQGSAIKVSGQSMEVVNKAELQRVTDDLRVNLELSKATTGDIEYVPVQAPVAKK
jgi:Transcriptional regulator